MHQSGTFAKSTTTLTASEERAILEARAEMASRCCDSERLAAILEALVLDGSPGTVAEMNARLDEHAESRMAAPRAA